MLDGDVAVNVDDASVTWKGASCDILDGLFSRLRAASVSAFASLMMSDVDSGRRPPGLVLVASVVVDARRDSVLEELVADAAVKARAFWWFLRCCLQ